MDYHIEKVASAKAEVGEGPVWNPDETDIGTGPPQATGGVTGGRYPHFLGVRNPIPQSLDLPP